MHDFGDFACRDPGDTISIMESKNLFVAIGVRAPVLNSPERVHVGLYGGVPMDKVIGVHSNFIAIVLALVGAFMGVRLG